MLTVYDSQLAIDIITAAEWQRITSHISPAEKIRLIQEMHQSGFISDEVHERIIGSE